MCVSLDVQIFSVFIIVSVCLPACTDAFNCVHTRVSTCAGIFLFLFSSVLSLFIFVLSDFFHPCACLFACGCCGCWSLLLYPATDAQTRMFPNYQFPCNFNLPKILNMIVLFSWYLLRQMHKNKRDIRPSLFISSFPYEVASERRTRFSCLSTTKFKLVFFKKFSGEGPPWISPSHKTI